MAPAPNDPRAIANLMLDESQRFARPITHVALQKLLYFAHALYLIQRGRPLVSGYFEAWPRGPVHPAVYESFKTAGNKVIDNRAVAIDPLTGEKSPVSRPTDSDVLGHVARIMAVFGGMTAGQLIELSHAPGGPWALAVDKGGTSFAYGARITDDLIKERFNRHKITVRAEYNQHHGDDLSEDQPPARHRSG